MQAGRNLVLPITLLNNIYGQGDIEMLVARRHLILPTMLTLVGALVILGLLVLNNPVNAATAQGTSVVLELPRNAHVGELISVKVVANNVHNLAGFQVQANYDPSKIRATGVLVADDLKLSGRDLVKLGPVLSDKAVIFGAATCPVRKCNDAKPKQAQRINQGVNGRIELGTIELYTETAGQYVLSLEDVQLVDPQGNLLAATTTNAILSVIDK